MNLSNNLNLKQRNQAHKDTRIEPEVRAHHQGVPTSPLRSPQRAGSLSTLILSQTTTKIKDGLLTYFAPRRIIQTSRSTHTIRMLPRAMPSRARSLKLQE